LCLIFNVLHFDSSSGAKLAHSPQEGDVGVSTNPCQKFNKPGAGRSELDICDGRYSPVVEFWRRKRST